MEAGDYSEDSSEEEGAEPSGPPPPLGPDGPPPPLGGDDFLGSMVSMEGFTFTMEGAADSAPADDAAAALRKQLEAKDAELAALRKQLEAGGQAPAAAAEPEPADPYAFDLGIGAAMASIDANLGLSKDILGKEKEVEAKGAELESAQGEVARLKEQCAAEKQRADAAEGALAGLQSKLDAQVLEGQQREQALQAQAQEWAQQQQQAVMAQAEEHLKMMQEQFEEQLASRMAEAEREREAAVAAAAAPSTEEKRIDPSDGRAYTQSEFEAAYGGLDEWASATPAPGSAPAPAPKPAEGVPPAPTRSADALAPKSAEWFASKQGRMLVQYEPSAKWAAYGAIAASKGQLITIRDKKDENWWQVTVSGVQGTVPASMVEVIREEEKLTHLTQLNAGGGANSQPVLNVAYKGRVGAVHQGFLAKTNSKYVRAGSGDLAGLKQQAQERLKKKEDWKERFFVLHAGEDPWLGYYKDEPEYLSGKKPKGAVKIRTAQAQKIGDEMSTTFLIATKDRNMKVRCDSHAGTAEWISMINTTAREARARDARVF